MIRLIWATSVHTRYFLRRYMPTNILLDAIRTRRGLKWGIPAMLLAIPYLVIANVCSQLIDDGAPGWLHLVALWAIWCALKTFWIGPISVLLLIRARNREAIPARRDKASQVVEADDAEERVLADTARERGRLHLHRVTEPVLPELPVCGVARPRSESERFNGSSYLRWG